VHRASLLSSHCMLPSKQLVHQAKGFKARTKCCGRHNGRVRPLEGIDFDTTDISVKRLKKQMCLILTSTVSSMMVDGMWLQNIKSRTNNLQKEPQITTTPPPPSCLHKIASYKLPSIIDPTFEGTNHVWCVVSPGSAQAANDNLLCVRNVLPPVLSSSAILLLCLMPIMMRWCWSARGG
jgi:hypothetical protein